MDWSPEKAMRAYLGTLKMCKDQFYKHGTKGSSSSMEPEGDQFYKHGTKGSSSSMEPEGVELLSALAAGTEAKLIVEVATNLSPSTLALACAAKQTGGRLICILSHTKSLPMQQPQITVSLGHGSTEIISGNPQELLRRYHDVDFALVDYAVDGSEEALEALSMNQKGSIMVGCNLFSVSKNGNCGKGFKGMVGVMLPIWKGMEIVKVGSLRSGKKSKRGSRRWVVHVDPLTGEEHFFRSTK